MIDKSEIKELFDKVVFAEMSTWKKGDYPAEPCFYFVKEDVKGDNELVLVDVSNVLRIQTQHSPRGRPMIEAWYRLLGEMSKAIFPRAVIMQSMGWRHTPSEDEGMDSYMDNPIRDRDDKISCFTTSLVGYNNNGHFVYFATHLVDVEIDKNRKFVKFGEVIEYDGESGDALTAESQLAERCQWGDGA